MSTKNNTETTQDETMKIQVRYDTKFGYITAFWWESSFQAGSYMMSLCMEEGHNECSPEWKNEGTIPATEEQTSIMKSNLEKLGYEDFIIVKRLGYPR